MKLLCVVSILGFFLSPSHSSAQNATYSLYKVKPGSFQEVANLTDYHLSDIEDAVYLQPFRMGKSTPVLIDSKKTVQFERALESRGIRYSAMGKTLIYKAKSEAISPRAEDLFPMTPIPGTTLFYGIGYRLGFRDLGNAPVTYKNVDASIDIMTVERRQAEWPKYQPGGTRELDGVWMFIYEPSDGRFRLVNLGTLMHNPYSAMYAAWSTNPAVLAAGCPYNTQCPVINRGGTWNLPQAWVPRAVYPDLFQIRENTYRTLTLESGDVVSSRSADQVAETRTLMTMRISSGGLTAKIIGFQLEEDPAAIEDRMREVTMISRHDIINNSSKTIKQTVSAEKSVSDTFTFGFKESLKVFTKVTVMAGIPLIGKAETEAGIEGSFEAYQELSSSTTHTFAIHQEVPVAPFKRVHVHGILSIADNVIMPFRAKMEVTLNVHRLTRTGHHAVPRPVPAELLEEYLKANKVDGVIVEKRGNVVVIEVTGIVRGTWGITTVLDVQEAPL